MKNNPKDLEVLEFIDHFIKVNGYAPTRIEIATALNNGHAAGAQHYIIKLQKKEYINVGKSGHRAIGITAKGKRAIKEANAES